MLTLTREKIEVRGNNMNIKEAIQATLNGEIVKGTTWGDGTYFKYDAKKALILHDGTAFVPSTFADEEFEICEELAKPFVIEKWLLFEKKQGYYFVAEADNIDAYINDWCSDNAEKIKLLGSYKVEL